MEVNNVKDKLYPLKKVIIWKKKSENNITFGGII